MATLPTALAMFEQTMESCVNAFGMNGKIQKFNDVRNYDIIVVFTFKECYLSVNDYVKFPVMEFQPYDFLDDIIQHLKDIKYQFNFYFNGIWG
jgi:hypothetical protein